jgi:hypothetical protein
MVSKPRIKSSRTRGETKENCRHRPAQYLINVLEQDHRAIKRRMGASQHFRSFWGAWRTIAGYEAIHMIRKGQACGSAPAARGGLVHCFILGIVQRGDGLILRALSPNFALTPKLQHYLTALGCWRRGKISVQLSNKFVSEVLLRFTKIELVDHEKFASPALFEFADKKRV